jgi:hypothetical protein
VSLVDPLLAVTTGSFAAANYVPLFANTESTALPSHRFQPLDFRQQLGNILPGVCNKILISHGSPYQFNVLAARHYEARPTVVISAFDVRFPWSWGCLMHLWRMASMSSITGDALSSAGTDISSFV